jgi:hypothetical protein
MEIAGNRPKGDTKSKIELRRKIEARERDRLNQINRNEERGKKREKK